MPKNIVDNALPKVWATEDTLFWKCMNDIEEFIEYITKFKDIMGIYDEKYLSTAYRNLKLDAVRLRKDGSLIHVEHHSEVKTNTLSRNFEYLVTLHATTGKFIYPFIFNTGKIPKKTIEFASPTSFFSPAWINTQEIEASEKLNNIKYKLSKQEKITVFEVLDLIWMPKFKTDQPIEDIVMELVEIFENIIMDEKFFHNLRDSIILWAGKYVVEKEKIKKVTRGLKMSAMEAKDLSAKIKSARIEGALLRSEEKGREEGFAEGEKKFVLKLLKKHTPQEISQEFEIPLERIKEIENDN